MSRIPPPSQKASRLLAVVADAIGREEMRADRPWTFLSYSAALERLGVAKPKFRPGSRLQRHGLNELNEWTREFAALPKIAALIVEEKTMRPNPKFAESHGVPTEGAGWLDWWIEEANRSIRYDWSPFLEAGTALKPHRQHRQHLLAEEAPALAPDERDILRWLAAGQTEAEILRLHPELRAIDIRSVLRRAADRLQPRPTARLGEEPRSTLAARWAGKFELPEADASDPRLTYLLERYRRNRE